PRTAHLAPLSLHDALPISTREEDVAKAIKKLTGGVDYAFECVGVGKVVEQAYNSLSRGGTAVSMGVPSPADQTSFRTLSLPADERTLKGSWYGSARPQHDFPRLLSLYRRGKLRLDELVTRTYSIDERSEERRVGKERSSQKARHPEQRN